MDFSQVYWFKQLCIANIDNVYDRFVKGTKKQNNSKEVKKLMIEIVRSGLGNFSYDNGKKLLLFHINVRILINTHLLNLFFNFRRYERLFKLIMF